MSTPADTVPLLAVLGAATLTGNLLWGRSAVLVVTPALAVLLGWWLPALLPALGAAAGIGAGGLVGAHLVKRYCAAPSPFTTPASVLRFALLAGLLGPAVTVTLSVPALCASSCTASLATLAERLLPAWLLSAAAVVTLVPAVLTWARLERTEAIRRLRGETGLAVLVTLALGLVLPPASGLGLHGPLGHGLQIGALAWAVARLGVPGITAICACLFGVERFGADAVGSAHAAELAVVTIALIALSASRGQLAEAAKRLATREDRYRSLVETLREVVLGMQPDGRLVFANAAWTNLTGHPRSATIGRRLEHYVHPADADFVPPPAADVSAWMRRLDGREIRLRHLDGTAVWVHVHLTANDNDSPPILGTLRDLSSERLAAARLEERVTSRTAELSQAYAQQRLLNRLLRIDAGSGGEAGILTEVLEVVCSAPTLWRNTRGSIFLCRGQALELAAGNVEEGHATSLRSGASRALAEKLDAHVLVGEEPHPNDQIQIVLGDPETPLGVMALLVDPPRARSAAEIRFHESIGRQVATLIRQCRSHAAILEEQARRARLFHSNQSLTRRMLDLQETERQTLARELHDELGQWLVAIQVEAEHLLSPERADGEVADSARAIRDATRRMYGVTHAIMTRLRPPLLDELGLASSLSDMVQRGTARSAPLVTLDVVGDLSGIPSPLDIHLYRIVQEGITNAWRHAGAHTVSVRLESNGDGAARSVRLHLRDDGCGFDVSRAPNGFGLAGMRERASAVGGQLDIVSSKGGGTSIRGHFPWLGDGAQRPDTWDPRGPSGLHVESPGTSSERQANECQAYE